MKLTVYTFIIALVFITTSCKNNTLDLKDGLYAKIETTKGDIIIKLEYEKAPITVANFVSLTEGKNPFVSENFKEKPFFNGLTFHRVEKGFVIQGGDPLGNGSGDPGYIFNDEITDLKHKQPGTLSMANSGPNTNGSQFFITLEPAPFLDGKHSVFGYVVQGMEVVNNIEANDIMNKVSILRKGEAVKKFLASKIFNDKFKLQLQNKRAQDSIDFLKKKAYDEKFESIKAKKIAYFNKLKNSANKTTSGFKYKITEITKNEKPKEGRTIHINYSGFLEDGTLFDTSLPEVAKMFGVYNEQRALQNGYSALP